MAQDAPDVGNSDADVDLGRSDVDPVDVGHGAVSVRHWEIRAPPVSTAIVEILADELGEDPETMTPLYDIVDPEVFDLLFDPPTGTRRRGVAVSFPFGGSQVVVKGNGEVEIGPLEH